MGLKASLNKVIIIFILVSLFSSVFIFKITSAEDAQNNLIKTNISIEFESPTDLKLTAILDIEKIDVFDTVYEGFEISDIADSNQEILGAIKLRLRDGLKNQIQSSFENAETIPTKQIPEYNSGLFYDYYTIYLSSDFFNYKGNIDVNSFISGCLDASASVRYDFSIKSEVGWNNSYVFKLSPKMSLDFANTTLVNLNKDEITWNLDNWNGKNPEDNAALKISYKNPTTPKQNSENISIKLGLDFRNIDNTLLKSSILAGVIDISEYNPIPGFISNLKYAPSDSVRLIIDSGFFSWEDVYNKTFKNIQQDLASTIEQSSLNQTINMVFYWDESTTKNCTDPYNITNMNSMPKIEGIVVDDKIEIKFCGLPSKAFFGLINSGATANISDEDVNFGDNLEGLKYVFEGFLNLPENITLNDNNTHLWNKEKPISGLFSSQVTPDPPYEKEEIDTYIEIELEKIELNLLSFFTGKTELATTTKIRETISNYVTKIPNEFNLPEKINISFLNSDVYRVCIEEGVFKWTDVDIFLNNIKNNFEDRAAQILDAPKIKGIVDKSVFQNSLLWDGDISNMNEANPLLISNYANKIYPSSLNLSIMPLGFEIENQTFLLEGFKDRITTYRIIFPKGISVKTNDIMNGSVIKGKTKDGKEYVEVSLSSEEDVGLLSCHLTASPIYILGLLLPCILSFVLVIILIVIFYIFRRKRGGKKLVLQEEIGGTGYEGEDYYVPPPPQSNK